MKKLLLLLIILATGVGGYIISQLDFSEQPTKKSEDSISLSENEAEEIALKEINGTITSTTFYDEDKPYYEIIIDTEDGQVIVQVDVGTKFVTTFADVPSSETTEASATSKNATVNEESGVENEVTQTDIQKEPVTQDEPYTVDLPLSKEAAIQAAQEQFNGELDKVISVENGNTFTYEVHLKNATQNATIIVNKDTGEIDQINVSKKTLSTPAKDDSTEEDRSKVSDNISEEDSSSTLTKPTAPTPPSINGE